MHTEYAQKMILALAVLLHAISGSTMWAMNNKSLHYQQKNTPQDLHQTLIITPQNININAYQPSLGQVAGQAFVNGLAQGAAIVALETVKEQINNHIINRTEYQTLLKGQHRDKVMDTLKAQRQIFEAYSSLMKDYGHLLSEEEKTTIDGNYFYFLAHLDQLIPTEATIHHQQQIYFAMQPKIEQIINYTAMLQNDAAPEIQQQIRKELVATSNYFKPLVEVPQRTNFDILKEAASSPAGTFVGGAVVTVGAYALYAAIQK